MIAPTLVGFTSLSQPKYLLARVLTGATRTLRTNWYLIPIERAISPRVQPILSSARILALFVGRPSTSAGMLLVSLTALDRFGCVYGLLLFRVLLLLWTW